MLDAVEQRQAGQRADRGGGVQAVRDARPTRAERQELGPRENRRRNLALVAERGPRGARRFFGAVAGRQRGALEIGVVLAELDERFVRRRGGRRRSEAARVSTTRTARQACSGSPCAPLSAELTPELTRFHSSHKMLEPAFAFRRDGVIHALAAVHGSCGAL